MKKFLQKLLFLFPLFIITPFLCYAQQPNIDSLQNVLKQYGEDTNKVNVLNQLSEAYRNQDPVRSTNYNKLALSLAEVLEYKPGIAVCYENLGIIQQNEGNYDLALSNFLKSLSLYEETGNKTGIAGCLNNIGTIHFYLKNYEKTLEYWGQSLNMEKKSGNTKRIAKMLNNIGVVYEKQKDYDKALEYHNESLQIRKEVGDKAGTAQSNQNIAILYAMRENFQEAVNYFEKSLEMRKQLGNKRGISQTTGNIGQLYLEWAEYQRKKDLPENTFTAKYQKAKDYIEESLKIAKEINAKVEIKYAYLNLSEINEKQHNTDEALRYYKLYSSIKDTLFTEESSGKIAEMDAKYQVEKAKREKEVLEKNKKLQSASLKNQRIIIWSAAGGIVLLALLVFFIYRSNKQKHIVNIQLERKNASILRQKSEIERINKELEKLSIVASETDNSVFIMDAEGNFEWVNEGFKRLSGYTLEEFIKEKGKNIIKVSGSSEIESLINEVIEKKQSAVYESINRSKDGNEYWVQTTLTPIIGDNGSVKKLVAIDSDITKQKKAEEEIRIKNRETTDSIRYAQNIQSSMMPTDEQIKELLPNSFVLFKPQAIVSGDFYWMIEKDGKVFFCAADCTGHGVPGAFMSMICSSLLNEAVNEKGITKPSEIFYDVRKSIIISLKQTEETQKDGMDAVFCIWDKKNNTLEFALANNPLYLIRGWELQETERDKQPVGFLTGEQKPFTNHKIKLQKNDTIYIFSDGFQDQFGGPRDKKFSRKRFKELLLSVQPKSMEEQKETLNQTFEDWKGEKEQTDDILVIGVRV